MNKFLGTGRLVKDPELTTTNSGVSVLRFTLAINRRFAKDGEQEADFLNVSVWNKLAENCAKYLKKGSLCGIVGELQTRSYNAKDGSKRFVTEIVASEIDFLDSKPNGNTVAPSVQPSPTAGAPKVNQTTSVSTDLKPIDDEDLPF